MDRYTVIATARKDAAPPPAVDPLVLASSFHESAAYRTGGTPLQGEPPVVLEHTFIAWLLDHQEDIVGYARDCYACPFTVWMLFVLGRLDFRQGGRSQCTFACERSEALHYCGMTRKDEYIVFYTTPQWVADMMTALDNLAAPVWSDAEVQQRDVLHYPAVTGAEVLAFCYGQRMPAAKVSAETRA